ncbi:TMEM175 family protein [Vagococcus carniphilus]|uniref:TMEM175 family protein n=1 Tax=Vagococcus carniphilus TaxID=218144 RepID=UPI003BAAB0F7
MIKGKDLNRLISFSDAIVAVAITLLVLPLTDLFRNTEHPSIDRIIHSYEFISTFSSLLISFFVIYGFWNKHRKIFYDVDEIPISVDKINKFWLFSVILIPAATNINFNSNNVLGIWIYGMTLIFSTLMLQLMDVQIHPGVKLYHNNLLVILLICLLIVSIKPEMGQSVFYLIFLSRPLRRLFPKVFQK